MKNTKKTVKNTVPAAEPVKPAEKYSLTEEHKAQLKPWGDQWIKNAMSTRPMSSDDKIDVAKYVKELYTVSGLTPPKNIIFAPSPFATIIIGGFASAISILGDKAKISIKDMATAVMKAADVSKNTYTKWYVSPYTTELVRSLNSKFELGDTGIECVKKAQSMWNGGNQWSGWVGHISFFRHVVKLSIDYKNWDCYEQLAKLSGPRIVGEDFCIVSDFPKTLTVNAQNLSHNDTGPFCEWADGSSVYSINGVRVPAYIVLTPEQITVEKIELESNLEVKRVMITRYGQEKFILDSKAEVVHVDDFGTLYKKTIRGDEDMYMVKVANSTPEPDGSFKDYFIRVDPNSYNGVKTARAAVASTWRKKDGSLLFAKPEDYQLEVET